MPRVVSIDELGKAMDKALGRLVKLGADKADEAYRAAGIKLFTDIIIETPVDEGTARNNWQITFGEPAKTVLTQKDPNKGLQYVKGKLNRKILNFKANGKVTVKKVFLTNNLPYIGVLEFGLFTQPAPDGGKSQGGYSRLAPAGMVRKNVVKFPRILSTFARTV